MSNYLVWERKAVDNACVLAKLGGVERRFELNNGVSRQHDWPKDATYSLNPDFSRNLALADNFNNIDMLIVASAAMKDFLEARAIPGVEYLPVTIVNHKGKPHADAFIIHLVDPVDCLEVDQCGAKFGRVNKAAIKEVEKLVIDESRIPEDRQLFRPDKFPRVILVARDLANAIDAAGFSGVRWIELDAYPED